MLFGKVFAHRHRCHDGSPHIARVHEHTNHLPPPSHRRHHIDNDWEHDFIIFISKLWRCQCAQESSQCVACCARANQTSKEKKIINSEERYPELNASECGQRHVKEQRRAARDRKRQRERETEGESGAEEADYIQLMGNRALMVKTIRHCHIWRRRRWTLGFGNVDAMGNDDSGRGNGLSCCSFCSPQCIFNSVQYLRKRFYNFIIKMGYETNVNSGCAIVNAERTVLRWQCCQTRPFN